MTFHTKTNRWITKNRILVAVVLYIFMITAIFLFRYSSGHPLLFGEESYAHISVIQDVEFGNSPFWQLDIFEMILYLLLTITPQSILFLLAPLLGLISLLLFIRLATKNNSNPLTKTYFLILVILTPAFMYTYTTLSAYSFIIVLTLVGFTILQSTKKKVQLVSIPFFALIGFSEIVSSSIVILILVSLLISKKNTKIDQKNTSTSHPTIWQKLQNIKLKKNEVTFSIRLAILFTALAALCSLFFRRIEIVTFIPSTQNIWQDLITDFGALSGISIFVFILSITGLFYAWKRNKTVYWQLLILIPAYLYNQHSIFLLSILFSYTAAIALARLTNRSWQIPNLKSITIFLIILGIIFSSITFVQRASMYSPSFEILETFHWLDEYDSSNKGTVLSFAQNAHYVTYNTLLQTFDNSRISLDNFEEQSIDSNTKIAHSALFSVAYPQLLFPLFNENNIQYVHIGPLTKAQLNEDQGIRFALRNENFKMIYSSNDHEIWEYEKNQELIG